MNASLALPSSQKKRKASVSSVKRPVKRTRSVSTTLKISHIEAPPNATEGPKVAFVPRGRQAYLGGIPEELLLKIMRQLEDHQDALAKLCRTNARCKRIAQEVLYEKISHAASHYEKAQAIARNRRLADSVRFFHWTFGGGLDSASLLSRERVDARILLVGVLRNAHKVQHVMLGQMRHLCPDNVEASHTPAWLHLFDRAVTRRRPMDACHNQFTHLKRLFIVAAPISIEDMSSVFRLPSLETLELTGVHQTTPFRNWSVPESTCSIQRLTLQGVMMDVGAVAQMIASLRTLRHLVYHRSIGDWEPFGATSNPLSKWPEHSWKGLGDAMRRHGTCLETFSLLDHTDKLIMDAVYPNGSRDFGVLGSLRDFQKLKAAAAPLEAFLDVAGSEHHLSACLPAHVNYFCIKHSPVDSESWIHLAPPVLASLQGLVCVDPNPLFKLPLTQVPLRQTQNLSGALTALEQAGISVKVWVGDSCFASEDLRRMECEEEGDTVYPTRGLIESWESRNDHVGCGSAI